MTQLHSAFWRESLELEPRKLARLEKTIAKKKVKAEAAKVKGLIKPQDVDYGFYTGYKLCWHTVKIGPWKYRIPLC